MDKRTIVLVVTIFTFIIVGMFGFAYLKNKELSALPTPVTPVTPVTETPDGTIPFGLDRINTTEYFSDGTHTFVGEILMPTPCDLLEVEAVVMESFPEQILLNFTVVNTADVCAQVITPQRFSVSAVASKEATVSATIEGVSVPLNITPALPGERPEDFEIFIKG